MEYYKVFKSAWMEGLNPYYNGRYSWRGNSGAFYIGLQMS